MIVKQILTSRRKMWEIVQQSSLKTKVPAAACLYHSLLFPNATSQSFFKYQRTDSLQRIAFPHSFIFSCILTLYTLKSWILFITSVSKIQAVARVHQDDMVAQKIGKLSDFSLFFARSKNIIVDLADVDELTKNFVCTNFKLFPFPVEVFFAISTFLCQNQTIYF